MMNQQYYNSKNRKKVNGPTAAVLKHNETGSAPTIVAQGSGHIAQKIIELAKQNNIHLQEDETLVNHLLDIDLGDSIPPQLYVVIAEILILLEELEKSY